MSDWPDVRLSKFLSLVLRHRPQALGISLDPSGWADLDELLDRMDDDGIPVNEDRIRSLIRRQKKSRFTLDDERRCIRANYGHSINVDLDLDPGEPPRHLFHGTAARRVDAIFREGLKGKGRQYVHLSRTPEEARSVGRRHGKPRVLRIRARDMHAAGHRFYHPGPGIWLVEQVPPVYVEQGPD